MKDRQFYFIVGMLFLINSNVTESTTAAVIFSILSWLFLILAIVEHFQDKDR